MRKNPGIHEQCAMQLTGDFLEINASQEPKSISIVVIVVASDLQDEEFSVELTALLHQL